MLLLWRDLEIDIPKFWLYIAEVVAPAVEKGTLTINDLRDASQPLVKEKKAAIFFGEILNVASRKLVCKNNLLVFFN